MTEGPPVASRGRWTVGLILIGGSVFGLMFDWDALLPALLHRPFNYNSHGMMHQAGLVLGNIVLPLTVAVVAPRKSFLWAAAALVVAVAWSLLDRVVALNGPGFVHDLLDNATVALVILLFLCGPLSLIRFWRRRHKERKAQRITALQTWMQQQTEEQPGVWPPPIQIPPPDWPPTP